MRSIVNIFLIGSVILGPYALRWAFAGNEPSEVSHELIANSMLSKVTLFTSVIATTWISIGLSLAYLVCRFTFGKRVKRALSFSKFAIFSILPSIAFALTFIVKPPSEVFMLLSEVFGNWVPAILATTAFVFGMGIHLISSMLVESP